MVMIGILPDPGRGQLLSGSALSANPRYELLNEQIFAARGEDLEIDIGGVERLATTGRHDRARGGLHDHPVPPARRPRRVRARYWNAAPGDRGRAAGDGCQLAVPLRHASCGARPGSPLFEQATDTRREELKAQGVRPRVWFGERWITSIFDLFEENVRYFPALLPVVEDEDPLGVLGGRRRAEPAGAAAAQRHDLPLEPSDLRHRARSAAPAGGEPRAAGRADGRRHARERRLLLRAGRARWPRTTGRCGPRCPSPPAEENFYAGAKARDRRAGVLAGRRRGAGDRAGAAPPAADGARRAVALGRGQ